MPVTIEELDRRVSALEAAQNDNTQSLRWVVAKLGRVQSTLDEHTLRLDQVESRLERVETSVNQVASKIDALPRVIAELLNERLPPRT